MDIHIDGKRYAVLADSQLPSGKNAITSSFRPSQSTDPSRMGSARWKLSGPLGSSREKEDGYLGVDYADNLDTLWDGLLTSSIGGTDITLSGSDPGVDQTPAMLGQFQLGTALLGGGLTLSIPQAVSNITEDRGYVFFSRGAFETQTDPDDWSVVETEVLGGIVLDEETWQGDAYLALGSTAIMQRRYGVSSSGSLYQNVTPGGEAASLLTKGLKVGNDRIWAIDATPATDNKVFYSLDPFTTISTPFAVGDSMRTGNGIGTLGPYAVVGNTTGVYGFTDAGKPVTVQDFSEFISQRNGDRFTSGFGWLYFLGFDGIYAWFPNVANPVGVETLIDFEGAIDGYPTEVRRVGKSLFAAYLTTSGDTYIVEGRFGPGTEATGAPVWYPFKKLSSVECHAINSTSVNGTIELLVGRGSNATVYPLGLRGRRIDDPNYTYATSGGTWYGTTMMRGQGLHKFLRQAILFGENCTSANYWQLAFAADEGSYVNVGGRIETDGHHILRPTNGSSPNESLSFHTLKPRLTQVAASASAPPQLRGFLEVVWDERPDTFEELTVAIKLDEYSKGDWETLGSLGGHETEHPVEVSLNGEKFYAHLRGPEQMRDIKGDGVRACQVTLLKWELGDAVTS